MEQKKTCKEGLKAKRMLEDEISLINTSWLAYRLNGIFHFNPVSFNYFQFVTRLIQWNF